MLSLYHLNQSVTQNIGELQNKINEKLDLEGGSLNGTLNSQTIVMQTGSTLNYGTNTIIDINGNVWRAVYNDLAEWFLRGNDEKLMPGDVLIWNGQGVEKSKFQNDKRVVGVYSDSYGICLGGENKQDMKENINKYVSIGLTGRVWVNVTGDINIGDILCTSNISGVATKSSEYIPGTIIGKALENHSGNKTDRIMMLIMNI